MPEHLNSNSASKTLEYAYDDWCIYKFAEALGDEKTTGEDFKRANSYKNIFDPATKFMRAKNSDGSWKTPVDPLSTLGQGFIEGNAWNYSLYVPQDVQGFIDLLGGKEKLSSYLDSLFTMTIPEKYFAESEDVTKVGAIGNYIHGNEPSHHVAYLYCYTGEPWKTQERVHEIMKTMTGIQQMVYAVMTIADKYQRGIFSVRSVSTLLYPEQINMLSEVPM